MRKRNSIHFTRRFHEDANKDFVIKKISYLRTTFRKELKENETSKLTEAGSDEIYEPKLWFFHNIIFLRYQEILRAGQRGLKKKHKANSNRETWYYWDVER